jgi:hypothetical protein
MCFTQQTNQVSDQTQHQCMLLLFRITNVPPSCFNRQVIILRRNLYQHTSFSYVVDHALYTVRLKCKTKSKFYPRIGLEGP